MSISEAQARLRNAKEVANAARHQAEEMKKTLQQSIGLARAAYGDMSATSIQHMNGAANEAINEVNRAISAIGSYTNMLDNKIRSLHQ